MGQKGGAGATKGVARVDALLLAGDPIEEAERLTALAQNDDE